MPKKIIVTPWEVVGDMGETDYNKLIKQFGTQKIDEKLFERIKKHTKELHYLLRRKIFFSHRDLNWILDEYEKGNKFALYTGRKPSDNVHIGHILVWKFTKWLQDKFDVELYFQITNDEAFLFGKKGLDLEQANKFSYENILDIIALGFNPKKTFIFTDTDYMKTLYPIALKVSKHLTFSTAKAVFGFKNANNVGQIFFTCVQSAPAILPSVLNGKKVPVLIPHAIDQDPHFRITRDVAPKLGYYKPAAIHSIFLPSLQKGGKMSASDPDSAIFTTDSAEDVERKIKNAFSGGRETIAAHRKYGGNPDIDRPFQYLKFFFEEDDKKLKKIHDDYKSGKILSGEMKQICIEKAKKFIIEHQKNREKAKKDIDKFMKRD